MREYMLAIPDSAGLEKADEASAWWFFGGLNKVEYVLAVGRLLFCGGDKVTGEVLESQVKVVDDEEVGEVDVVDDCGPLALCQGWKLLG